MPVSIEKFVRCVPARTTTVVGASRMPTLARTDHVPTANVNR
jgi:hypothetical protein